MSERPVFVDESGRRAKVTRTGVLVGFLVTAVVAVLFGASILSFNVAPKPVETKRALAINRMRNTRVGTAFVNLKQQLEVLRLAQKAPVKPTDQVCLAFFAPWEETGVDSLRANAGRLTHLCPVWGHAQPDGTLDSTESSIERYPENAQVLDLAGQNGINLMPVITNSNGDKFNPQLVHALVLDNQLRAKFIESVANWVRLNNYGGINMDFEEVAAGDLAGYASLIGDLKTKLKPLHAEVTVDIQASLEPSEAAQLANAADFAILMAYDEHDESGAAGPIASSKWVQDVLRKMLTKVDPQKLVLGLGNYAYDWKDSGGPADSIGFQEAMGDAQGYNTETPAADIISFDRESLNSQFKYVDEDNASHTVWMLDAPSIYNQWQLGQEYHLRGAGLWALGLEDPSIWEFFDRKRLEEDVPPIALEQVGFPFEIGYSGKGEILSVKSRPTVGHRRITSDSETNLIEDVTYESFGTPYLIEKSGYKPKKLVLTFDDGPDSTYTPQILNILKEKNVPGAFFVIGANAEANPELVQREYSEGHEVGNHTFFHPNLGFVRDERVNLEINANQRLIEALLGHSTTLFRAPYNADSQPETAREVKPVSLAATLGLTTVGENIDPNDWDPNIATKQGTTRPRTADDIVELTINDILARQGSSEEGNIILLHDGGGDRTKTVEALSTIINSLEQKGFKFTTVADLMGKQREDVMPKIPAAQNALVKVDYAAFQAIHWFEWLLATGFVAALILGAARILFLMPLAIAHEKRAKNRVFDPAYHPEVTALIAAYNEETTIVDTVRSVLRSNMLVKEVIVVDDGSKDQTAQNVHIAFRDEAVHLIEKPNGGKASALNLGIEAATSELLFCIDADTQLEPEAIGLLARHFSDPQVAAVAGNVQVGNVRNAVTGLQAVEYRTSQNMDRRAYALLNAITVVPGAIGMWRKSAVQEVGGYLTDTLAEDMDLTWRLRKAGYTLATEAGAVAYTEAPESVATLTKQRFRWSYGTLQCLFKHRDALGRYGWFGKFALPTIWLFQIFFQILGPLVDLQILVSIVLALAPLVGGHSAEFSAAFTMHSLYVSLALYLLFFGLELTAGLIAYRMDRAKPWPLAWLFVQRFFYRQLMYKVMLKSLWKAAVGARQGWGKLNRTGNVGK